jgi:hypothetical protein
MLAESNSRRPNPLAHLTRRITWFSQGETRGSEEKQRGLTPYLLHMSTFLCEEKRPRFTFDFAMAPPFMRGQ